MAFFSSRERILADFHDPGLSFYRPAGISRARTAVGTDIPVQGLSACISHNKPPPISQGPFHRTVAGRRLPCFYLFWLPTNEIINEWQVGPHSGARFLTETFFASGSWAVKLLPANPGQREGHFLNLKGKHRGLIMSSGHLPLISWFWKLFHRRLWAQLKISCPVL